MYKRQTSSVYSSSVCLPEGNYNLVMSDGNGFCCKYGLGHYSVYFDGGRTVRDAPGLFMGEDMTPFEVTSDDVLAALATANPSQSLGPSTYIPPNASSLPLVSFQKCTRRYICLTFDLNFFLPLASNRLLPAIV